MSIMKDTHGSAMTDEPRTSNSDASHATAQARPPMTDEEWMEEFQRGSADGFTILFDRYKQSVYAFFRRRITDTEAAEELTQETFLAVLRAKERYRPETFFRVYLYAIAYKLLTKYRRKMAFRATFLGVAEEHHEPGAQPSIEADLSIRQAVGRLDPKDRDMVLLREFDLLSYAEIADVLQLPVNTVRSRLFRARTALRQLLESSANPHAATAPLHTQEQA